jgi:tripartite-type tricarboxylate transporter receptor subunit TctC
MFAPKGTPTNIIDKLANNLDAALEEPAVKK